MVPSDLVAFFAAAAGVAGALTGLLFVALSVASVRLTAAGAEGQAKRIGARAALTAFTNSLVVSLFALIPGHKLGPAAFATGLAGLAFVLSSLLSLIRLLVAARRQTTRATFVREVRQAVRGVLQGRGSIIDLLFLIALVVVFVVEAAEGASLLAHPGDAGAVQNLSIVVVACFLIGISRSWDLIGGPNLGVWRQVASLVGDRGPDPDREEPPR